VRPVRSLYGVLSRCSISHHLAPPLESQFRAPGEELPRCTNPCGGDLVIGNGRPSRHRQRSGHLILSSSRSVTQARFPAAVAESAMERPHATSSRRDWPPGTKIGDSKRDDPRHRGSRRSFTHAEKSRRSRAAANASAARISSSITSGKSARISPGDIPPARYSRRSETLIRVPRITGLPLRIAGSITTRARS
jgi:hypothetical protein